MSHTSTLAKDAPQQAEGVIFDQHYSDSLLRLALGELYNTPLRLTPPAESDDVLLSLLLFGRAHLVPPFWLSRQTDKARKRLETLTAEGLIRFIPDAFTTAAYNSLGPMVEKGVQLDGYGRQLHRLSIDPVSGVLRDGGPSELRTFQASTDLETDLNLQLKRFRHLDPLISSAIRHLGDLDTGLGDAGNLLSSWDLSLPNFRSPEVPWTEAEAREAVEWFLSHSIEILAAEGTQSVLDLVVSRDIDPDGSYFKGTDAKTRRLLAKQAKSLRALLLGTLTATSCARYATQTRLPLRTSASPLPDAALDRNAAENAYQLFKIQFDALQYPVLTGLDDVRRLRESAHLQAYRTVVSEYSYRLQAELTEGRPEVFRRFKNDLLLASKDLSNLNRKMRFFDKFMFYFWFPVTLFQPLMSILGIDVGLDVDIPYSVDDILFGPATQIAYRIAKGKQGEVEWILLGRP